MRRASMAIKFTSVAILAVASTLAFAQPSGTASATLEAPRPQNAPTGVSGSLDFVQAGDSLIVTGTARGMNPGVFYVSLVYDKGSPPKGPNACEPTLPENHPHNIEDTMFLGIWLVDAAGNGVLLAGPNETPLDLIRTVSIRDTTINGGFGPEAVVACGLVVPAPSAD